MKYTYKALTLPNSNATRKNSETGCSKNSGICCISDTPALKKAGTKDLVALHPLAGNPPIVKQLGVLEIIAGSIVDGELIHIHGETGTGKNAIIEAITCVPENWQALCEHLCVPHLPLKVFPIEMALFETISEIYSRRALNNGKTYDEPSYIVQGIRESSKLVGKVFPLIWLKEVGRVSAASVQGGLLNLMTKGLVRLNNNEMVSGAGIAWLADSNYHTGDTSTHVLVTQDDALNRRWTVNLSFDYPSAEQEIEILKFHMQQGYIPDMDEGLIFKVVELGHAIRQQRRQGTLTSLASPSIYGFTAFLRVVHRHPKLSIQEIAENTLLGAASAQDREDVRGLFSDVFGIRRADTANEAVGDF